MSTKANITAETGFVEQQSDAESKRFVFSYTITIENISDGVIQYPIPLFAESSILVRSRFSPFLSLLDMDPLVLMMLFFWQILHIWWLTQHFENVLISFFVLLESTRLRDILVFCLNLEIDKNWVLLNKDSVQFIVGEHGIFLSFGQDASVFWCRFHWFHVGCEALQI